MDYKKMIKAYAENGGDEKKMWASVDVTAEALDYIKETNPEKHDCIMRKLSEALYGKHYSEELALADVAKLHYTDATGAKHTGAHWTIEQIEAATKDKTFPTGTTKFDKYVAYNFSHCLLASGFDDAEILSVAYLLFFRNDNSMKIWDVFA